MGSITARRGNGKVQRSSSQVQLVLLNSNPDPAMYVRRLFSLTNLDRVLRIADSEEEIWGA